MSSKMYAEFLGRINTGTFKSDYIFIDKIGKGGSGKVYKVKSKKDHQTYAVKKVRIDQQKKDLCYIKRELINHAQLSHENVVRYYEGWVEESPDQSSTDSETNVSRSDEREVSNGFSNLDVNKIASHSSGSDSFGQVTDSEQTHNIYDDLDCDRIFNEDVWSNADLQEMNEDEDYDLFTVPTEEENKYTSFQSDMKLAQNIEQISASVSGEHSLPESVLMLNSTEDSTGTFSPRFLDLYIKMEFCNQTLREAIDSCQLVNNDAKSWNFFWQIVKGLKYIHNKGIIHRDLKPRNIFITKEDVVKIGDFGLSKLIEEESDSSIISLKESVLHANLNVAKSSGMTGMIGTVEYTAPEVLSMPSYSYGHEVDLFSLGLVFFEMCFDPFKTYTEKAEVFMKLKKDRIFPDTFDHKSKETQMKVIEGLLNPNPKARIPLSKLMKIEDFIEPETSAKFIQMLPEVISRPNEELYQTMIKLLFSQRTGKCLNSLEWNDIPKPVIRMIHTFASVAESHCFENINLPLFLPATQLLSPDSYEVGDQVMFLDSQGNPVILSDSSLRAFIFQFERNYIPRSKTVCYNTQLVYLLKNNKPISLPHISFFSLLAKDDILTIAKALLILWNSLREARQIMAGFTLCLTHKDLESGLAQIYDLTDKEQKTLYKYAKDTTQRLEVLEHLKQQKKIITIPDVLVTTIKLKKMSELIGHLHKTDIGFKKELSISICEAAFDSIKCLEEVLDQMDVHFDLRVELFMTNSQVELNDSGIKFQLKSKSKSYIIARGGQYEMKAGTPSASDMRDLFWYEVDIMKLEETEITTEKPDVVILYDKTCFNEVKSVGYLLGRLTSKGFSVSEVERNQRHISPVCKFSVHFYNEDAIVQYKEDSRFKKISMKIQTVINHIEQRRNIPREFILPFQA